MRMPALDYSTYDCSVCYVRYEASLEQRLVAAGMHVGHKTLATTGPDRLHPNKPTQLSMEL